MRIDRLLTLAAARLQAEGSPTPRLDAEVLMMDATGRDRVWLYAWGDRELQGFERARFEALVAARAIGHPVAYLIGEREFWGLALTTSESTLIPRPDTECLVEAALARTASPRGDMLDLGTGTGAIALAFASERPGWRVLGVDRVAEAVQLARLNAERLGIDNARFAQSDWFAAIASERFDLIASNPPYLADNDCHLERGDVRFEPRSALVAKEAGLADLHFLIRAAREHLEPGGWLLLEHGMAQGVPVREALTAAGYHAVTTLPDLAGHERVSLGQYQPTEYQPTV
ncbi:peptide chain release factor N(5)-glutamine methyltransferase [Halomonas shantousis]